MIGSSSHPPPRGYSGFYSPHDRAQGHHGGTAIFVDNSRGIAFTSFNILFPLQLVAVQLHLRRTYTVCSLYFPPNSPVDREDFVFLVQQLSSPFIILGDYNGGHTLWRDALVNPRGAMIASVVEALDLSIFNAGDHTHYHIQTDTTSVLDLSLCSPDALLDFTWNVTGDLCGSDHYPILLSSPNDHADWGLFKHLAIVDSEVDGFLVIDSAVEYFSSILQRAGELSIPQTTGFTKRRLVPWAHTYKEL